MKVLISTLILYSALSALPGPAVAERVVSLNCAKGTCSFSEELGPDQTHAYRGFCAEENPAEFKMVCHAVKGTTCDGAMMSAPPADYWYCSCTNWDPTQRKNVSIDLLCNSPS